MKLCAPVTRGHKGTIQATVEFVELKNIHSEIITSLYMTQVEVLAVIQSHSIKFWHLVFPQLFVFGIAIPP